MNTTNTIIALIIVALVIGGVALLARSNDNTINVNNGPTPTLDQSISLTPTVSNSPTITPYSTIKPTSVNPNSMVMSINMNPVNGSTPTQSGTATIRQVNGHVVVTININQDPNITGPQPAHIHTGSCPNVGDVIYPLSSVINGKSTTTINTTIGNLQSQLPLAINVHKSDSEINAYTSCGDLK